MHLVGFGLDDIRVRIISDQGMLRPGSLCWPFGPQGLFCAALHQSRHNHSKIFHTMKIHRCYSRKFVGIRSNQLRTLHIVYICVCCMILHDAYLHFLQNSYTLQVQIDAAGTWEIHEEMVQTSAGMLARVSTNKTIFGSFWLSLSMSFWWFFLRPSIQETVGVQWLIRKGNAWPWASVSISLEQGRLSGSNQDDQDGSKHAVGPTCWSPSSERHGRILQR